MDIAIGPRPPTEKQDIHLHLRQTLHCHSYQCLSPETTFANIPPPHQANHITTSTSSKSRSTPTPPLILHHPPLSQAQPRPLPLRQRHPTLRFLHLRQNPQQPQRIRPRPAPTERQVPPDEGNLPAVSLVEPHELGAFLGAVYKGRFSDGGPGEGLDVCCWCRQELRCCCGRGGV